MTLSAVCVKQRALDFPQRGLCLADFTQGMLLQQSALRCLFRVPAFRLAADLGEDVSHTSGPPCF